MNLVDQLAMEYPLTREAAEPPTRRKRARSRRLRLFGRQALPWLLFLQVGQDRGELLFEPGMQDRIGHRDDTFGAQDASRRTKEGQQFGGASPLVLVGLQRGMPFRLPRGSGLR